MESNQPKLSKSEQSRLNGAKSKGPVTEAGKHRAALNALKHATYADVNRNWLPIDAGVLSNESRVLAFRIFEGYCRQLQPQSDAEILLVKQLTGHQCHLDRLLKIEAAVMQTHLDQVMPNLIAQCKEMETEAPNSLGSAHAFVHCVNVDDKVLRSLDRQRRSHERGIKECLRRLKELRQNFPIPLPESPDVDSFLPVYGVERCTQEEADAAEADAAEAEAAETEAAVAAAQNEEVKEDDHDKMQDDSDEEDPRETEEIDNSGDSLAPQENQALTQDETTQLPGTNLPKAA